MVALSLGLHLAVALLFSRPPPPPRAAPARAPVFLEWVEVQRPPAPPPPQPPPPRPAAPRERPPAENAQAAATPRAGQGATSGPAAADAPRHERAPLAPDPGLVLRWPEAADAEGPRGATVRNDVTDAPPADVVAEYRADKAARQVKVDLGRALAQAANDTGRKPRHFRRLASALGDGVLREGVDTTPLSSGEAFRDAMETFLGGSVSPEAARRVTDSPLGYSVQHQTVVVPNIDDQRFREGAMQMMAGIEARKDLAQRVRLRAVLELTLDPRGTVADVTVVEKSGDVRFDESVLHLCRKVSRRLPDDDEKELGGTWWRSRLQFTYEPPKVRVVLLEAQPVDAPMQ